MTGMVWQWNPEVRLGSFERQRLMRINGFDEKDKASLYDAFDVLVQSSTEESFALAYLELSRANAQIVADSLGSFSLLSPRSTWSCFGERLYTNLGLINSEAGRFADQERARASDASIRARRRARASTPVT